MNDKAYRDALDQLEKRVQRAIGRRKMYVIYSAYPEVKDIPQDNLDRVAFKGKARVMYNAGDFFGNGRTISRTFTNPTYLQLAVFANEAIKHTGDHHHVYFEGLWKRRANGKTFYELCMGS